MQCLLNVVTSDGIKVSCVGQFRREERHNKWTGMSRGLTASADNSGHSLDTNNSVHCYHRSHYTSLLVGLLTTAECLHL